MPHVSKREMRKIERKSEEGQPTQAIRHRMKEGMTWKQAEGNAQRARATHGGKVSGNSGATRRKRKKEKIGNEAREGRREERGKKIRGPRAARCATTTTKRRKKKKGNDSAVA